MKSAKYIAFLMLIVIPAIAAAQMPGTEKIVTQVPFTFVVANHVIPIGECIIQRGDDSGRILLIRSRNAGVNAFATASVNEGTKSAKGYSLLFHRYGKRYYLVGVKLENSRFTYALTPSDFEKELLAQNVTANDLVVLASAK